MGSITFNVIEPMLDRNRNSSIESTNEASLFKNSQTKKWQKRKHSFPLYIFHL